MREGRAFRYVHSDPYNPVSPAETARRRAGDCKDKALWLCNQLQDSSARFVIGKMKRSSKISHAWVMWQSEGRWFVLDCTLNWKPIPVENVAKGDYVPLYSYAKNGSYRHASTRLMLANNGAAQNAPVANR
jgi:transglutaminase-like putative cysteine protease